MDYTKFFDPDILEMVGQARKEVQKNQLHTKTRSSNSVMVVSTAG